MLLICFFINEHLDKIKYNKNDGSKDKKWIIKWCYVYNNKMNNIIIKWIIKWCYVYNNNKII